MKTSKLEVYHIETLGTLDGPGVRTVIFFQGCPLKCCYCHNPDSWRRGQGKDYDTEDLVQEVLKYKAYFGKSGGVTLSGGEPLGQAKALQILVKRLKEEDIHIALDTSGGLWSQDVQALLRSVDLVLLDIKADNEENYRQLTHSSMENPMKVLAYLQEIEKPYWIRHVVLPGNYIEEHIDQITDHPMRLKLDFLKYHSMGLEKWQLWQLKYRKVF